MGGKLKKESSTVTITINCWRRCKFQSITAQSWVKEALHIQREDRLHLLHETLFLAPLASHAWRRSDAFVATEPVRVSHKWLYARVQSTFFFDCCVVTCYVFCNHGNARNIHLLVSCSCCTGPLNQRKPDSLLFVWERSHAQSCVFNTWWIPWINFLLRSQFWPSEQRLMKLVRWFCQNSSGVLKQRYPIVGEKTTNPRGSTLARLTGVRGSHDARFVASRRIILSETTRKISAKN